MKNNIDDAPKLISILKARFLFVLAIAILGNSKLAVGNNQHDGRKLANIPGFISIDCGGDEDYVETKTGIPYVSDKNLIDGGIIGTVTNPSKYIQPLRSLRSFPQGQRNCYTLRPKQGKNNKYLIRGRFVYENYDGKNQVPIFDLYLGVNKWVTVDLTTGNLYDVIHASLTDYIDVCLVNTGQGVPFISSLELRLLDNSIYETKGGALAGRGGNDIGIAANITRIRYQDDVYDRWWAPLESDPWIPVTSSSIIYSGNGDPYKLPAVVLQTAARTGNASIPLTYSWSSSDPHSKYYFYFHFSEIEKLEAGQQRQLTINLNGDRYLAPTVTLDYLKPLTIVQDDPPITGSQFYFSISAAEGTTLPPILNAVEVYALIDLPDNPTAEDDVEAIMEIKRLYSVARNWQGDPCLPSEFLWEGLNCSYDDPPRIISLNLSSSKLSGDFADAFTNLEVLQALDLSYNKLIGPLPEVLAQLSHLNTLDLRGNKLSGSVPEALLEKSKDGELHLRLDENPDLCLVAPCKRKKKNTFVIAVVASILVVLVLVFIFGVVAFYGRKRHEDMIVKSNIKSKDQRYSYSEVVKITNNFKTILGAGRFGSVYLGTLKDGTKIAVKLLSSSSNQGYKEFQAEAQLLTVVHHRNLVSLLGYCDEGENKALIYEYMANGNLQQHLSVTSTCVLKWNERLHIAVDAAHGLEYLHNGCKPPIIHRDLKASNILLNEYMQAKIADFGLSRAFASEGDSHVSTRPTGTLGYLDPQFQVYGFFNKKSDVYSFGIILLELITGQPAIIRGPMRNNHMLEWVKPLIERGDIQNIVDRRLEGEFNTNSAWKVLEVAMSCIPSAANQRPDMSIVLAELKECLAQERSQKMETRGL